MLTLLGINKILAVYVGPAGYAAIGQFQNAVQMISALASAGINTGVTKYTAQYHQDEKRRLAIWQTGGTICFLGSIILSVTVFILRADLATWFLKDSTLGYVFGWFSLALTFFVLNTFLLAILNGRKEIKNYVLANIAGSLLGLIVTIIMVVNWGLGGALVGLAIYQSLAFFSTLLICCKAPWFSIHNLFGKLDKKVVKKLAQFTAMALTTAAMVPLSHILIRNHLGSTLGWEAAGYWEAMWRLSGAYMMLVSTTLSVYYLPRLSELFSGDAIREEIIQGFKLILPFAVAGALFVYLARDFIITILFSQAFLPMETMFFWQLAGDVLKIASWLFAFVMLSKSLTLIFISTEIIFAILFYVLTVAFVNNYGLEGAAIAHAMNYAIYLLIVSALILKKIRIN